MTMETSPSGVKSVRLQWPQIGAIASITSLVIFVVGFITGAMTFKSEMSVLRTNVADMRSDNATTQERINAMSIRLATIEADIKYIGQGIAEIRLSNLPKK